MLKRIHSLYLLATLTLSGCAGSVGLTVSHLEAKATPDQRGVTYTLPKTEVTVTAPLTKITVSAGEFYTDLETYRTSISECGESSDDESTGIASARATLCQNLIDFGMKPRLKGFKPKTVTKYKMGKPTIETTSIQDTNHVYLVSVDSGGAEDALLSMAFEELGFLSSVTSERSDRTVELAVKTFQTVAELAVKAIPFGAGDRNLADTAAPNVYTKANGIFERITQIRSAREGLYSVSNSANLTVETIKHARGELDKLEASLLTYFVKKKVLTFPATYVFVPGGGDANDETILVFDALSGDDAGVCRQSSKLYTPVPKQLLSTGDCSNQKDNVSISVLVTNDSTSMGALLASVNFETKNKDKPGLRYRVPGSATIDVTQRKEVEESQSVVRSDIVVAQFGAVMALPAKPGGAKTKIVMDLFAKTGALKKFEISSTSAAAGAIEGLGTAGAAALSVVEAQQAKKAQKELESSEGTQLQKEIDLLKLKKEKVELERDLVELDASSN